MNNGFIRYKANTQKLIAFLILAAQEENIYNSKPYTGNILLKNKILTRYHRQQHQNNSYELIF